MSVSPAVEQVPEQVIPEWSLGDRLRKARRMVDLSQAEFAERLGQNQKTYAAWELDTSRPRNVVAIAKRIEAMTGVPAGWLLDTGATTRWYGSPSSSRAAILTLVSDTTGSNRDVAEGYGSSRSSSGHGDGWSVIESAETVNDADAA